MQTPIVTIVTCFFNEERFLEETIQSVLSQTYVKWELLLVDDGSSDKSTNIAKNYSFKFSDKIFYYEHKGHSNRGLSASRNLGISKANGSLVAFLDADDVWEDNKLAVQVGLMDENPDVSMLCEASLYWYSWIDSSKNDNKILVGKEQDKSFPPLELLKLLYPFGQGDAPCPSGIIIRRKDLLELGGFEDCFTGSYQMYEDQAFLFKVYLNKKVFVSSSCNNKYRQREGSLVQKVVTEGNYDKVRKYFLLWAKDYLSRKNIGNTAVTSLVNKALFPYKFPFLSIILKRLSKVSL